MTKIKKGLDLPITGHVDQVVEEGRKVSHVAVTGPDYVDMKPTMKVKEGERVVLGQEVFSCKRTEGVIYTAPATGTVVKINRGEKRVFQSIVIKVEDSDECKDFSTCWSPEKCDAPFEKEVVRKALVETGLWSSLRMRPYSKTPSPQSECHSLFVTAMDTNPLSLDLSLIIEKHRKAFEKGLEAISTQTKGKVYLCSENPLGVNYKGNVEERFFSGLHPAGNVGTHIHFTDPVHENKTVWHLGVQDVIAMGEFFLTGQLSTTRYIALGGPCVKKPRILKTRLGADLNELLEEECVSGENRIISGSAIYGHHATEGAFQFLRRYSNQVTVLKEGKEREFLGWHSAGLDKFSVKNIYLSKLMPGKKFSFHTGTHGSFRAMVPVGLFEKVMPLDILPTQLLRALLTYDTDSAQELGCLELDEEDLSLCTFVCPGKTDYAPYLRECLTLIEKEG